MPYAQVTWTSKVDAATGRPVLNPEADYEFSQKPVAVWPGTWGAHDWQPPSFNPGTGLFYFPKREGADTFMANYADEQQSFVSGARDDFKVRYPRYNRIVDSMSPSNSLLAWDPVKQRARWEVELSVPWAPGTLTTAGKLVFQGDVDGHLNGYDARNGHALWSYDVGLGVTAPPVTCSIDGHQYVSVLVGFGGGFAGASGEDAAKLGWPMGAIRVAS
jgi:glucose dehydrogenase